MNPLQRLVLLLGIIAFFSFQACKESSPRSNEKKSSQNDSGDQTTDTSKTKNTTYNNTNENNDGDAKVVSSITDDCDDESSANDKDDVLDSVASNIPSENSLPLAAGERFRAGIDADAPEKNRKLNVSGDDDLSEQSRSEDDTSASSSDWDELLKPERLADCKQEGKIYDRASDTCHKADVVNSYACTRCSIINKFKSIDAKVSTQIAALTKDGYQIDQCGEYNGEPIVFFVRKDEKDDSLKLKIKKICKRGSKACSN